MRHSGKCYEADEEARRQAREPFLSMAANLVQARAGGRVERCHGIPHATSYSNAAHSWGVAMLMHYLWPEDFPRLVLQCLAHDVPEAWVGDMPSPTLAYTPGVKHQLSGLEGRLNRAIGLPGENELDADDLAKVKACDRLDLYLWARDQANMGNRFTEELMSELRRSVHEFPMPERAMGLFVELDKSTCLPRLAGVMKELNA